MWKRCSRMRIAEERSLVTSQRWAQVQSSRRHHSLPVLLRQYFNLMGAQVCNLSLAKDFNQITEILMAAELNSLPKERLNYFIDVPHQPVYQHFSWYRGQG